MASVFYDKRTPGRPWIVKWRTPQQRYASFVTEGNARAFAEFIADQSRRGAPRKDLRTSLPSTAREVIERRIELDENGCWRWQGYVNKEGYAQVTFRGATPRAEGGLIRMTVTTEHFPGNVEDFERAPWLPCLDLAKARDREANYCADYVEAGLPQLAAEKAHAVRLMRDEDRRLSDAYRTAYHAWKTAVSA